MRPLDGITVVDVTAALAGPYGTFLLGALGARVIKVEHPEGGDRVRSHPPFVGGEGITFRRDGDDAMSVPFLSRGRGKESVTLNLKAPEAPEVFADLVRGADVVVENFSRGTADRLGIGYAACSAVNPGVVYCAVSGFGADAPAGRERAYDLVVQALSGVMMVSGEESDPPMKIGMPFADLIAPLFGVIGILSALRMRAETGRGQFVDVSMLGAVTSLVASEPFGLLEQLGVPIRTGNSTLRLSPFGTFRTRDGYVTICAPNDHECSKLFAGMGQPELISDERFATLQARIANYRELAATIEGWTASLPTADVVERLEALQVPMAPVREPAEAVVDPDVLARRETAALAHPRHGVVDGLYGPGLPIRFSDADVALGAVPFLGQDDERVYRELAGYTPERIAALRERGVIGRTDTG